MRTIKLRSRFSLLHRLALSNVFSVAAEAAKASAEAPIVTAKASERTARAAGDRAIATMGLQWAHDLRKILSEYYSVLVSYEKDD